MTSEFTGAHNRASIFNGENYDYWKDYMHIHINSIDKKVWKAIQDGPCQITLTNKDGVTIPKPEETWDTEDEKSIHMIGKLEIF